MLSFADVTNVGECTRGFVAKTMIVEVETMAWWNIGDGCGIDSRLLGDIPKPRGRVLIRVGASGSVGIGNPSIPTRRALTGRVTKTSAFKTGQNGCL